MNFLKNNILSLITLFILLCFILGSVIHNYISPKIQDYIQSENNEISQNINNNTITIEGESADISMAASKGLRSAVSIYCVFEATVGGGNPWNPRPSTQTYYSAGSGVIYEIDEYGNAFIITNYHVVYDADCNSANNVSDEIYIYLYGLENEQYAIDAEYVGGSPNYDIAVLRVNNSEILASAYASGAAAAVEISESDGATPGSTAIAIGNPTSSSELGGISVTNGIVSVDSEYITMTAADEKSEVTYRLIRIDTPVNSGNSGGGLFNAQGDLIGIVNAKISTSDIENIGYAIPVNVARAVADNIIYYCYNGEYTSVMRCILGVSITANALNTYYNEQTGFLEKQESIVVAEVTASSLAASVFEVNDIIKSITVGDKTIAVTRQYHLIDTMLDARVGDTVIFNIERNGVEMNVSVAINKSCLTAY